MKKSIIISLAVALVFAMSGISVFAQTTVGTGLVRGDGSGADPIVKVKWEMNGPSFSGSSYVGYSGGEGTDDSPSAGAQFTPPGVWGDVMNYTVCAIVTDPNGIADVDGVYADIYYPEDVAFHPEAPEPYDDQINGGTGANPDFGESGCGEFIEENTLMPLTKMDGYDLFCGEIYNNNNNLPSFFDNYNYDEICGPTGELMKEEAYVYCDDKTLTWEDPAGDYRVEVFALDKAGNFSYDGGVNPNYNYYEYLPLLGFELDFDSVAYGEVMLNTHKIISGDLNWDDGTGPNKASVRNVGNTRLYLHVEQDDMGLGMTSGQWNVRYDARIGNEEADWRNYWPEARQRLQDILDLSELEEMDFSIQISKYPSTQSDYFGDMDIDATQANFRECIPD